MNSMKIIACTILFASIISSCAALECYVCSNQTENTEKCLNTIKTCEQGEDVCLTEIRWGSQPYFTQGALKQYYVSKRCSTKKLCTTIRRKYMPYCTHIWYEDWLCSECCQGDRCNYYVISGSERLSYYLWYVSAVITLLVYPILSL
ncbi:uncharacterized protein LOC116346310 [Contarinia nasturtii]|uniref:uncharacterized protein LOC116346310 n=1 Tax=Contarinia nasturtii TaxID=265458 RepID=UPI0012D3F776|nr:uncharacterized protein LOC116346310 [Contarinia nasturtii]